MKKKLLIPLDISLAFFSRKYIFFMIAALCYNPVFTSFYQSCGLSYDHIAPSIPAAASFNMPENDALNGLQNSETVHTALNTGSKMLFLTATPWNGNNFEALGGWRPNQIVTFVLMGNVNISLSDITALSNMDGRNIVINPGEKINIDTHRNRTYSWNAGIGLGIGPGDISLGIHYRYGTVQSRSNLIDKKTVFVGNNNRIVSTLSTTERNILQGIFTNAHYWEFGWNARNIYGHIGYNHFLINGGIADNYNKRVYEYYAGNKPFQRDTRKTQGIQAAGTTGNFDNTAAARLGRTAHRFSLLEFIDTSGSLFSRIRFSGFYTLQNQLIDPVYTSRISSATLNSSGTEVSGTDLINRINYTCHLDRSYGGGIGFLNKKKIEAGERTVEIHSEPSYHIDRTEIKYTAEDNRSDETWTDNNADGTREIWTSAYSSGKKDSFRYEELRHTINLPFSMKVPITKKLSHTLSYNYQITFSKNALRKKSYTAYTKTEQIEMLTGKRTSVSQNSSPVTYSALVTESAVSEHSGLFGFRYMFTESLFLDMLSTASYTVKRLDLDFYVQAGLAF